MCQAQNRVLWLQKRGHSSFLLRIYNLVDNHQLWNVKDGDSLLKKLVTLLVHQKFQTTSLHLHGRLRELAHTHPHTPHYYTLPFQYTSASKQKGLRFYPTCRLRSQPVSLMDAGKRYETQESETEDFITHSSWKRPSCLFYQEWDCAGLLDSYGAQATKIFPHVSMTWWRAQLL